MFVFFVPSNDPSLVPDRLPQFSVAIVAGLDRHTRVNEERDGGGRLINEQTYWSFGYQIMPYTP